MKEQEVIKKTKSPLTKTMLKEHFMNLGIRKDDTLVVHCALSKLGFVIGGVQALLEALLETVSEGTIIMPAHSGDNSNPEEFEHPPLPDAWIPIFKEHMPAFNKDTSPLRGMGKLAMQFFAMKGTLRSNHPVVSFTARGKHAATITADHPLTPMFGMDSPLGRVYEMGGKLLLLGPGFENLTALHLSEIKSGKLKKVKEETSMIKDGVRQWVVYEDYAYDENDFTEVGKRLLKTPIVKTHTIGLADVHLMDAKATIDKAAAIIKEIRISNN